MFTRRLAFLATLMLLVLGGGVTVGLAQAPGQPGLSGGVTFGFPPRAMPPRPVSVVSGQGDPPWFQRGGITWSDALSFRFGSYTTHLSQLDGRPNPPNPRSTWIEGQWSPVMGLTGAPYNLLSSSMSHSNRHHLTNRIGYLPEWNPCETYVKLRTQGQDIALTHYARRILPAQFAHLAPPATTPYTRGSSGQAAPAMEALVVPLNLMENMAEARCQCRKYLDLFEYEMTGRRPGHPSKQPPGTPDDPDHLRDAIANHRTTIAALEQEMTRVEETSFQRRDMERRRAEALLAMRDLEARLARAEADGVWDAYQFAEHQRHAECFRLGQDATFDDCDLAQAAAAKAQWFRASASPQIQAELEARRRAPVGMTGRTMTQGAIPLLFRSDEPFSPAYVLHVVEQVAAELGTHCVRQRQIEAEPEVAARRTACADLAAIQQELRPLPSGERLQALGGSRATDVAQYRQTLESRLADAARRCAEPLPVNDAAGREAVQLGACRSLEGAMRSLSAAQNERLAPDFASQPLSARLAHQTRLRDLELEVRRLETACAEQVSRVAQSPAVLATLRHANPYQPALPNDCERTIAAYHLMIQTYGSDALVNLARIEGEPLTIGEQLRRNLARYCTNPQDPLQRRLMCEVSAGHIIQFTQLFRDLRLSVTADQRPSPALLQAFQRLAAQVGVETPPEALASATSDSLREWLSRVHCAISQRDAAFHCNQAGPRDTVAVDLFTALTRGPGAIGCPR